MHKNTVVKTVTTEKFPPKMYYGTVETPKYGQLFVAYYTEKNLLHICYAHFNNNQTLDYFKNDLQKLWPKSMFQHDDKLTKEILESYMMEQNESQVVYVILSGTDFQKKVWSALLEIPFGEERTYADIAAAIGNPKAVRAVASAIGGNNIAIFIPCHRVKAKAGDLHKYRWGGDLKKKILLNEKGKGN